MGRSKRKEIVGKEERQRGGEKKCKEMVWEEERRIGKRKTKEINAKRKDNG